MLFFDSHSHVNSSYFKDDSDEVLRRAINNGVATVLVGTDYKSSKKALEMVSRYQSGVYAAVGLHPDELFDHHEKIAGVETLIRAEVYNGELYQQLAKFPSVVAIGEIGLDYHKPEASIEELKKIKQLQKEVLIKQLVFAMKLNLPVILHCRQAHDDLIKILEDFRKQYRANLPADRPWGVVHCFSATESIAWQYFNLGLVISFTGLITFSQQWDSLIRKMPEDKLLIETDSPFMTPEPYRGRRSEPVLVKYVANRIAQIKNWDIEKVATTTTNNARRLFKII